MNEKQTLEITRFQRRSLVMEEVKNVSVTRVRTIDGETPEGLPPGTGQCKGTNPVALCIRPGEWLLICESSSPEQLLRQSVDRFGGPSTLLSDNSHGLRKIRISGQGAPWLLAKLSGIDFQAGSLEGEHCARTKMQHVTVTVHFQPYAGSNGQFDLLVDSSLKSYFWSLLMSSTPHADDLAERFGNHDSHSAIDSHPVMRP